MLTSSSSLLAGCSAQEDQTRRGRTVARHDERNPQRQACRVEGGAGQAAGAPGQLPGGHGQEDSARVSGKHHAAAPADSVICRLLSGSDFVVKLTYF